MKDAHLVITPRGYILFLEKTSASSPFYSHMNGRSCEDMVEAEVKGSFMVAA
jgi:hypothetical protein